MEILRNCHIGTSGWSYREWKGLFYPPDLPAKRFLEFYAKQFNTVEVNSTFYRLPKAEYLLHWREMVPPDFVFSIKASRFFTHQKKLAVKSEELTPFFKALEPLGSQLGPILFQLPPRWNFDPGRLRRFLDMLPRQHRYAFEFRDPSWLNEQTYEILRKEEAANCIYDVKGSCSPNVATTNWVYLRFHGPRIQPYADSYDDEFITRWGQCFRQWLLEEMEVFGYFDNTVDGSAVTDAKALKNAVCFAQFVPQLHTLPR